jgi:hypothetical protein
MALTGLFVPRSCHFRSTAQDAARAARDLREVPPLTRCRANVTRIRQSRPDSGPGFQVSVLETF